MNKYLMCLLILFLVFAVIITKSFESKGHPTSRFAARNNIGKKLTTLTMSKHRVDLLLSASKNSNNPFCEKQSQEDDVFCQNARKEAESLYAKRAICKHTCLCMRAYLIANN